MRSSPAQLGTFPAKVWCAGVTVEPRGRELTCSDLAGGHPVVSHPAEGAEGVVAAGADAHGAAGLLHHGGLAAGPGAINHVSHQVQAGLQQQAVIAGKQLLPNQLLHLQTQPAQESLHHIH